MGIMKWTSFFNEASRFFLSLKGDVQYSLFVIVHCSAPFSGAQRAALGRAVFARLYQHMVRFHPVPLLLARPSPPNSNRSYHCTMNPSKTI